ncbi:MAG: hypothetical protein KAT62_08495 [Desulfuromonadales bacterium]|nr:hypothetical protein [Desulfuromonadales bacterium]
MDDQEYKDFYQRLDNRCHDPLVVDMKKAFNWFLDYMGEDDWEKRRSNVIKHFREMGSALYEQPEKYDMDSERGRLAFYQDWVAWYLYLVESVADRPAVDEPSQSSRIRHFFATIGRYSDELKKVKGIESKLHDLLKKKINQPDSILFELVVAICYLKNGWVVEFIPETGANKTPDLRVCRDEKEFFVECKRLAKVTQYSEGERTEWLKRWKRLLPLLMKYPHSVFLDVEFKKEVAKTDENVIAKAFYSMFASGSIAQGFCIENEDVVVGARHIDMKKIDDHFEKWMVKYPSPQLHALFDENYEAHGSYTTACIARLVEVGADSESVLNIFADSIEKAYCAKWECTAIESIDKKAKDVKNLLVKAVNQAPDNGSTIIHIGYETLHGPWVEFIRDEKIIEIISEFDFGNKNIASIFCHSFQARNFANDLWDFAETTRYFGVTEDPFDILTEIQLMERDGTVKADDTHWAQDMRDLLDK